MKWCFIGIIVMTVFTILFFACEPFDNMIPDGVDEKGIKYLTGEIPTSMRQSKYSYFVLKSCEQRDDYIDFIRTELINEKPNILEYWELFGYTYDQLDEYTIDYFDNYNLVLIMFNGGSSSNSYKIEKIDKKNRDLFIRVQKKIPKKWQPHLTDKTYYNYLIPVKKEYFNGEKVIIEFRETTMR